MEAALAQRTETSAADRVLRLADDGLDRAFRLAGLILGDQHEAEDATQDALLRAWQAASSLRDPAGFGAWFDRILVNVCYERLRRHRRGHTVELPDDVGGVAAVAAGALARDSVGRALLRLSPEQRVVVVLRYWRDLSIEEIAERLDVPSGTVRSRLHYALRTLRAEIDRTPPTRPDEVLP
jgi:RNA polymerase sigma-70 factor, ECF subfamily